MRSGGGRGSRLQPASNITSRTAPRVNKLGGASSPSVCVGYPQRHTERPRLSTTQAWTCDIPTERLLLCADISDLRLTDDAANFVFLPAIRDRRRIVLRYHSNNLHLVPQVLADGFSGPQTHLLARIEAVGNAAPAVERDENGFERILAARHIYDAVRSPNRRLTRRGRSAPPAARARRRTTTPVIG